MQHKQALRIQVKSRYQTDNDRGILVKETGLDGFDFLVMVFLNIGYFSWPGHKVLENPEYHKTEYYTFPNHWIRRHLRNKSGWGGKIRVGESDPKMEKFRNEKASD